MCVKADGPGWGVVPAAEADHQAVCFPRRFPTDRRHIWETPTATENQAPQPMPRRSTTKGGNLPPSPTIIPGGNSAHGLDRKPRIVSQEYLGTTAEGVLAKLAGASSGGVGALSEQSV